MLISFGSFFSRSGKLINFRLLADQVISGSIEYTVALMEVVTCALKYALIIIREIFTNNYSYHMAMINPRTNYLNEMCSG